MNETDIVVRLIEAFGEKILPVYEIPKAYYPGGILNVKAIYLGCDPSNKHSTNLPYVFAHESGLKIFNAFINAHTEQLRQIRLSWNAVYTQNLCRNYFADETAKNLIWEKVASEFWVEMLREELAQFDPKIPVLLTSQSLLKVLGTGGYENTLAPEFYECHELIPIPASNSKLNRDLIPVYRGKSPRYDVSYQLKNERWINYKNSIIALIDTVTPKI